MDWFQKTRSERSSKICQIWTNFQKNIWTNFQKNIYTNFQKKYIQGVPKKRVISGKWSLWATGLS